MSSTRVPWPGSRGSSTWKPASANASATPRIEAGLPVKPCRTTAPCWPLATCDQGSAPAMIEWVMASIMAGLVDSHVRIVGREGFFPPVVGHAGRFPLGKWIDAIHRARRQAFVATTAQFGDNDDVGPVIEDCPELRWARTQTGIAVDALEHL